MSIGYRVSGIGWLRETDYSLRAKDDRRTPVDD